MGRGNLRAEIQQLEKSLTGDQKHDQPIQKKLARLQEQLRSAVKKFNPNHSPTDGRFTSSTGGSSAGSGEGPAKGPGSRTARANRAAGKALAAGINHFTDDHLPGVEFKHPDGREMSLWWSDHAVTQAVDTYIRGDGSKALDRVAPHLREFIDNPKSENVLHNADYTTEGGEHTLHTDYGMLAWKDVQGGAGAKGPTVKPEGVAGGTFVPAKRGKRGMTQEQANRATDAAGKPKSRGDDLGPWGEYPQGQPREKPTKAPPSPLDNMQGQVMTGRGGHTFVIGRDKLSRATVRQLKQTTSHDKAIKQRNKYKKGSAEHTAWSGRANQLFDEKAAKHGIDGKTGRPLKKDDTSGKDAAGPEAGSVEKRNERKGPDGRWAPKEGSGVANSQVTRGGVGADSGGVSGAAGSRPSDMGSRVGARKLMRQKLQTAESLGTKARAASGKATTAETHKFAAAVHGEAAKAFTGLSYNTTHAMREGEKARKFHEAMADQHHSAYMHESGQSASGRIAARERSLEPEDQRRAVVANRNKLRGGSKPGDPANGREAMYRRGGLSPEQAKLQSDRDINEHQLANRARGKLKRSGKTIRDILLGD